jgi:DNA-binding NarL/FixJ family response regulator
VTRAAYAAGFLRRARFEALYLEKFGESPHETWRRGLAATEPSAPAAGAAIGGARLAARLEALSPRERQVCVRVARGMLNKQIAAELGIAEGTVKVHRARGMARLGVTSAVELARVLDRRESGDG